MDVQPKTWGNPGPNSTPLQHKNYSNYMRNLNEEEQKNIDLILIDGRFRVACCLKCFSIINSNCFIAFDDFLNRPQYDIVKTTNNRMVILQKKKI